MSKEKRFLELALHASFATMQARHSEKDIWPETYDFVFGEISEGVKETGISIDYCDPDTDYKDDVEAYVNALNEKAESLSIMLGLEQTT